MSALKILDVNTKAGPFIIWITKLDADLVLIPGVNGVLVIPHCTTASSSTNLSHLHIFIHLLPVVSKVC